MDVAICDLGMGNYETERRMIEGIGKTLEMRQCNNPDETVAFARDAEVIMISQQKVDANVIEQLPCLRGIIRYGVGVDTVDIDAATRQKIVVSNVVHYADDEVAEQAIALIMDCARKVTKQDKQIRQGAWGIWRKDPVHRLQGRTLGLVGLGSIGRRLVKKLQGFEFKVLAYDPYLPAAEGAKTGVELVELPVLLAQADFISIHAPLTDQTRHIINADALKLMKPTAFLVNTSRGALVDTIALYEALKNNLIGGAGIDVHEVEPLPADYCLFELNNVVISDHAGWYSEESIEALQRIATESAVAVLTGKRPASVVNPEVYD